MNNILDLLPALSTGILLGAIFFGGLWWTVKRGLSSTQPARLFLGSLLLRIGLTLAGFHLVSEGQWEKFVLCLLGFTLARFITTRLIPPADQSAPLQQEADHAS